MSKSEQTASPVLEFKGSRLTVMALCLYSADHAALERELADKIAQAPGMFKQAPVLIDLQPTANLEKPPDIAFVVAQLHRHGMIPVGIRGGNPHQQQHAAEAGLSVLPESKAERARASAEQAVTSPSSGGVPAKVITQPVRSGQQVVAKQGDLVVLSMVSAGAEILATGHIHVYGVLRGRALAGVAGDTTARIFCQYFDAELIAVAGQYRVSEDYPEDVRDKPAHIYLHDDILRIETF